MKYLDFDSYAWDEGEPVLRSCWECNQAHGHLKDAMMLHVCTICHRYWIFGRFLDEFQSAQELDDFLRSKLKGVE